MKQKQRTKNRFSTTQRASWYRIRRPKRDKSKKDNIQYPRVIVEVLSPETETIDKEEKLDTYLDYPSIEEYILVGSQKKMVEVYSRDGDT